MCTADTLMSKRITHVKTYTVNGEIADGQESHLRYMLRNIV